MSTDGYPWYNQNTVDTLIDVFYNQGKSLYLIGDDVTRGSTGVTGIENLTHLHNVNNGYSGYVKVTDSLHPIVNGTYGTVGRFYHKKDIDKATQTNTGEEVILTAEYTNTPAIIVYEGTKNNKLVVQIPHVYL